MCGRNAARISRGRYAGRILAAAAATVLIGAAALAVSPVPGSLISVNPLGASPGVPIQISGTGFDPIASKNHVRFTPVAGGAPQTVPATAIATVDANRGIRRLNLAVPAGLPAGRATLSVINTTTGEISEGLSLDVLYLTLPEVAFAAPGATGVKVVMVGSVGTMFTNPTTTRVLFGSGISLRSVVVENAQRLTAVIDVSPAATLGPRSPAVRPPNQSLLATDAFIVGSAPPNRSPSANANGPYIGTVNQPVSFTSKGSTDPDNDPLAYAWTFGDGGKSSEANPTHTYQSVGSFQVSLTVSDGKGGTHTANTTAQIDPPAAQVTGIEASPELVRFSALDATRALTVIASKSDGTTVDVTAAAAGTTYASSNPFVAAVSADGVVTARGNGDVTITVTNGAFTDMVAAAVEVGVTLTSLELTPSAATLRLAGATQALTLQGSFSDGSVRDLTNAPGTAFRSAVETVATVGAGGLVTAVANGEAEIIASHGDMSAAANITVAIPQGQAFMRGAVFDDSRGLPLAGATVMLLNDGGGPVVPPATTLTDETGRYVMQGRAGDALVRVQKDGFTAVDRTVVIPATGAVRVFDARLTPVDTRANLIQSAFGGQVRDTSATATLSVAPGSLVTDSDLRLTPLSAQGLATLLPPGWSPVAAAEVRPLETTLTQPAMLVLPNVGGAPAGSAVTIAAYDRSTHRWIAAPDAQVSGDGRTITIPISSGGQFVALLPDAAPHTPPAAVAGLPLAGVPLVPLPPESSADGTVVPRAAAPGDSARAIGRVGIGGSFSVPSGTSVQVHVNETFELLDASTVSPLPFTQDILVHARPRPPTGGSLGAVFPITPSRRYTIQELMRGVLKLDVVRPSDLVGGSVAGPQGAMVTDAQGDSLAIPAGALGAETLVELRRSAAPVLVDVPTTFSIVAAFEVDMIGMSLTIPGRLSTPVPPGIAAADQILLVQSFLDAFGVRRARVAGVGHIEGDRLVSDHVLGSLVFPGVTGTGTYAFVKSSEPLGFVTGIVSGEGSTPAPLALVTSSSAPFVDVTGATGRYVVAARAAADSVIAARHLSSSDAATGTAHPAARDAVVVLPLTLTVAPPSVVATSPSAGATNVPLDTSITIDFSEPIDPSTVSDTSVVLQTGGAPVVVSRTLSQDRRRLTVRPESPLLGKTAYTLSLTPALKDLSGAALVAFTPVTFTTLDPTKPPQPPPGQIVASLPDEDGLIHVTGAPGTSEAQRPVTLTNARTQETFTVLAGLDGAFRLQIAGAVGDVLTLTLRDASGRDTTIALSQLDGADGSTSIGAAGGVIRGPAARTGTIRPGALVEPGVFQIVEETAALAVPLASAFSYVDRFGLRIQGGVFNRLTALTLSEAQARIAPAATSTAPFQLALQMTVPADFLINSAIRFSAVAQDIAGIRRSASGSTVVVPTNADAEIIEATSAAEFPAVFLSVPRQATPNQVLEVSAVAPAARIDLTLPAPANTDGMSMLLTRAREFAGEQRLEIVDQVERFAVGAETVLRTIGRTLPGMTGEGSYAVVGTTESLVFVTGQMLGSPGGVMVDGLPFAFVTTTPNSRFSIPVPAGQPFTLRFVNEDGTLRGATTGQAPSTGTLDVGDPLNAAPGVLRVTVDQDEEVAVDINAPIVLRFSEPVAISTLSSGIIVADKSGARVFGRFGSAGDGRLVEFRPARRWRFGTTYRITISTDVLALSGARLLVPSVAEFTTFAPVAVSQVLSDVTDVSVTGVTGIAGNAAGLATFDVASALNPKGLAPLTVAGGVAAVTLLPGSTIATRTGDLLTGRFALAASGGPNSAAVLYLVDISDPASPAIVGSTQLTRAVGQSGPAGVPDARGEPRKIVITEDNRALVAVSSVGLIAVRVDQMAPANTTDPWVGLAGRYPSSGVADITSVALLGNRVLVTGVAGIEVLDATTLQRLAGLSSDGTLQQVDAIRAFAMDVDGDTLITANSEIFDLAVATGGPDGTIQFFRIPPSGNPALLAVARTAGNTSSVAVDSQERLAFVSLGASGVAFVDLDGPASVQPLDSDRNGVDDRLLSLMPLHGSARRAAVQSDRGLLHVAAGAPGAQIVRITPPRASFVSLRRDPLRAHTGDEETLSSGRSAFTSDDAILVDVQISGAENSPVFLTIDAGQQITFENGGPAAAVTDGRTQFALRIVAAASAAAVTLRLQTGAGVTLAQAQFSLVAPPAAIDAANLILAPPSLTLTDSRTAGQVSVGAVLRDQTVLNVTRSPGTVYSTANPAVASVSPTGDVASHGGGATDLLVASHGAFSTAAIHVERAAQLVRLSSDRTTVTLTDQNPLDAGFFGEFSNGERRAAHEISGSLFSTSSPAVVTIAADGSIHAAADGFATVRVVNGAISADLQVVVELRGAVNLDAIDLSPVATASADQGTLVSVLIAGSGSLAYNVVTFLEGATVLGRAVTDSQGRAATVLRGLTAGQHLIVATVIDPASGSTLTDSEPAVVTAPAGDNEPNGDASTPSTIQDDRPSTGALTPGSDSRDVFRISSPTGGTLRLKVSLLDDPAPGAVRVDVRPDNGVELLNRMVAPPLLEESVEVPPGAVVIGIELVNAPRAIRYALTASVQPAALTLASVSPLAGPPGTQVTMIGSGFSQDASDNLVSFSGVKAKVITASATALVVAVPANAVDGPVRITSAGRSHSGPQFTVGPNAGRAASFAQPSNPQMIRHDPVSGALIDGSRLWVDFDPTIARAQVEVLVAPLEGTVVGLIATLNRYLIEFPSHATLAGLASRSAALSGMPEVVLVARVSFPRPADSQIDARDRSQNWNNGTPRSAPFDMINLFEAVTEIRRTPPFNHPLSMKRVRIAVLDTGFDPVVPTEFGPNVQVVVPQASLLGATLQPVSRSDMPGGHGTGVASLLAALNDSSPMSGMLGSLFWTYDRLFAETRIELVVIRCGILTAPTLQNSTGVILDPTCIELSYEAIGGLVADGNPANDIDVLNLSFGEYDFAPARAGPGCPASGVLLPGAATRCKVFTALQPLGARTLVVAAAGNEGIESTNSFPASIESALPHVISVGAVAVSNINGRNFDGTSEKKDERAFFSNAIRRGAHVSEVSCDPPLGGLIGPLARHASNCGPGVTLAAPGEDLLVVSASAPPPFAPPQGPYGPFNGTSGATPLVGGLAAILQAIRPAVDPLPPTRLRDLLRQGADDISAVWKTARGESMLRINALTSVRLLLPTTSAQRIYIADQPETSAQGQLVGLSVQPDTGRLIGSGATLTLLEYNGTIGRDPQRVLIPPPGDRAYVLARTNHAAGDGVFIVDTFDASVQNFIPLAGSAASSSIASALAVRIDSKSPMVATHSGRLLFVGAGRRIIVIDTVNDVVVEDARELAWPALVTKPTASALLVLRLGTWLTRLEAANASIVSLDVSPDDRTLYVLGQSGSSPDNQPGVLIEIDIALDRDANPTTNVLEPDLSNFWTYKSVQPFVGHDEPSEVVAAPDGKFVYVTNGGIRGFVAILPGQPVPSAQLQAYVHEVVATGFVEQTVGDLESRSGYTQILTTGLFQAFRVESGQLFSERWSFPSELSVGWTPDRPSISDQFVRKSVNSERPFSMAFHPNGRRAVVPFFQTGNFGVLDLTAEESFPARSAPAGVFSALVAVTPSLKLDEYLVPPEEEASRWFATRVHYSQNGRFAVGVHKGRREGAISLIDDSALDTDLSPGNLAMPVEEGDHNVPLFRNGPLCASRDLTTLRCTQDVATPITEYPNSAGTATFGAVRDAAIQPFVSIVLPGFGDRATETSDVLFKWRDQSIVRFRVTVLDLGPNGMPFAQPSAFPAVERSLTAGERFSRTVRLAIADVVDPNALVANSRYRILVEMFAGAGAPFSFTTTEMVYQR